VFETALATLPDAKTQSHRPHFRIVALPGGRKVEVSFVAVRVKDSLPLWMWQVMSAVLL